MAKVAYLDFEGVCSTELLVFRPKPGVHGRYLFYQLLSMGFIAEVNSFTYGTKMPRANPATVANQVIALPPAEEQRLIAAFLDRETARINELVAGKERLLNLLEEERSTLVTQAVTKGLDPEAPLESSDVDWFGRIPAHWEVAQLKYCAVIVDCLHSTPDYTQEEG